MPAPRDSASMASAPVPANRSTTRAPSAGRAVAMGRECRRSSRAAGRRSDGSSRDAGATAARPFNRPPTMRIYLPRGGRGPLPPPGRGRPPPRGAFGPRSAAADGRRAAGCPAVAERPFAELRGLGLGRGSKDLRGASPRRSWRRFSAPPRPAPPRRFVVDQPFGGAAGMARVVAPRPRLSKGFRGASQLALAARSFPRHRDPHRRDARSARPFGGAASIDERRRASAARRRVSEARRSSHAIARLRARRRAAAPRSRLASAPLICEALAVRRSATATRAWRLRSGRPSLRARPGPRASRALRRASAAAAGVRLRPWRGQRRLARPARIRASRATRRRARARSGGGRQHALDLHLAPLAVGGRGARDALARPGRPLRAPRRAAPRHACACAARGVLRARRRAFGLLASAPAAPAGPPSRRASLRRRRGRRGLLRSGASKFAPAPARASFGPSWSRSTRVRTSTDRAFLEIAELERPERNADQPVDAEPQMFEHALDLAVLAFAQAHGQPDVASPAGDRSVASMPR